jgi:hypothetical protein
MAAIMPSQDVFCQATTQLSRRQISAIASYSQPTASPVVGSMNWSGV